MDRRRIQRPGRRQDAVDALFASLTEPYIIVSTFSHVIIFNVTDPVSYRIADTPAACPCFTTPLLSSHTQCITRRHSPLLLIVLLTVAQPTCTRVRPPHPPGVTFAHYLSPFICILWIRGHSLLHLYPSLLFLYYINPAACYGTTYLVAYGYEVRACYILLSYN